MSRRREQRRLAEDGDDDRVGRHAGEDGRDQRVGLEVVAVEHLDGEQRGPERGAKHRGDAGRDAGDHQDPALGDGDAQEAGAERAERAPDLHGGTLAPRRPPGPEREDRRDRLHPRHALAHDAVLAVEGVDHRVAAAAARLGRQLRDDAARQRADRREQRQQPGRKWRTVGSSGRNVSPCARSGR
jgi:hypothetical protein